MKNVIILPTYNERDNITPLVKEIFSVAPDVHIMVVDDNSPDGTAIVVEGLICKYPQLSILKREKKDGLGGAYIAAFKKALQDPNLEHVVMMDADFSHHPRYLSSLFKNAKDYDLVIGSRYVKDGGIAKWELWRQALSRGANFYVRTVLSSSIRDWTAGFNCIRADVLRRVDFDRINLSGYAFIQEIKYSLLKVGAKVKEVPIIFEERRGGESKISGFIMREGIIAPWKIKWRK